MADALILNRLFGHLFSNGVVSILNFDSCCWIINIYFSYSRFIDCSVFWFL